MSWNRVMVPKGGLEYLPICLFYGHFFAIFGDISPLVSLAMGQGSRNHTKTRFYVAASAFQRANWVNSPLKASPSRCS